MYRHLGGRPLCRLLRFSSSELGERTKLLAPLCHSAGSDIVHIVASAAPSATGTCNGSFLPESLPCLMGSSPKSSFLRYRNNILLIFLTDVHVKNKKKRKRKESHKIMYLYLVLIIGLNRVMEVCMGGL